MLASIHTGGGACVDPPLAGFGQISLTKSVVMNSTPPKETNTFSASFDASPGKRAPSAPPAPLLYTDGAYLVNPDFPEQIPPPCPIPGYVTLDGGTITAQGLAMNPVSVVPTLADGKIAYQADLPSGFLRGGTFQISSVGGQSVGPLRLSLPVGAGIQVSSQFPVGTFIDDRKPLTVSWTGGDPGSIVTVRLISHSFLVDYTIRNEVYASAGSVTFLPIAVDALGTVVLSFNIPKSSDAEVVVEVGPDPSQDLSFNALGLTLGGRMSWKYEYHFPGLTMQQ